MNFSTKIFFTFFFLCISQWAISQVAVYVFPKNNQIFQRDAQDSSLVTIEGNITMNGLNSVKLQVLQNNGIFYEKNLYPTQNGPFTIRMKIKAGMFNYSFKLFQNANQLIQETHNIVSGDVFVFYGQSNSIGYGGEMDTYVMPTDAFFRILRVNDISNYNGEWLGINNNHFLLYDTGMFPIEFLKSYRLKSAYPVGIIQAAYGGAPLASLNDRDAINVLNPSTRYGTMLRKLVLAGVKSHIKYMIFRQGEADSETAFGANTYHSKFGDFMNNLALDLPTLSHIFNFQLNILLSSYTTNPDAEVLRDYQRKTPNLFPKIRGIASAGLNGFLGVHYSLLGHKKASESIIKIFAKEVLNETTSLNVYSPSVSKIFFNANKTKITLKFQEGISMRYPNDSTTTNHDGSQSLKKMSDAIYFNNIAGIVQSGLAIKNKIILSVPPIAANPLITYLPNITTNIYNGLYLKNTFGEGALTFARQPVYDALQTPSISGILNANNTISLSWTGSFQSGLVYRVERATGDGSFVEIANLNLPLFLDTTTEPYKTYHYRIWAESDLSESEFSNTLTISTVCPEQLILNGTNQISGYHEASISIHSSAILPHLATEFRSKQIVLLPGFSTNQFLFQASAGGCK